jgi:hypothetical protein
VGNETGFDLRRRRPSRCRFQQACVRRACALPESSTRTNSTWPRTRHRTVTHRRPGAHPKPRRQRRRHAVKRASAMAAALLGRALNPHPMSARAALRIQTLHRPTGQILHRSSRVVEILWAGSGKGILTPPDPPVQNHDSFENWRDCAPATIVCQQFCLLLLVVLFRSGTAPSGAEFRFGGR